jgi:hypothetical protein
MYQMRCLEVQEDIWIVPKGKLLELMIRRCHLFRVPRNEWIEGLGGTRVRVLGVDLVTDDSSISDEQMGEGPSKGGGTDLTEVTGNSEDTTERLATNSGSGILLAIPVVDTTRKLS